MGCRLIEKAVCDNDTSAVALKLLEIKTVSLIQKLFNLLKT